MLEGLDHIAAQTNRIHNLLLVHVAGQCDVMGVAPVGNRLHESVSEQRGPQAEHRITCRGRVRSDILPQGRVVKRRTVPIRFDKTLVERR